MTPTDLYKFLLAEQARINASLDEIKDGDGHEVLRGQWTMTQMIIEKFGLGKSGGGLH
jgi:hypothetical protein